MKKKLPMPLQSLVITILILAFATLVTGACYLLTFIVFAHWVKVVLVSIGMFFLLWSMVHLIYIGKAYGDY